MNRAHQVDQQILADNDNGIFGDCMRACIASLLGLSAEAVPHFLEEGNASKYHKRIADFLDARGLMLLEIPALDYNRLKWNHHQGDLYHLMSGPSPRGKGMYHSVVGKNGVVWFDPHPSRHGLAGPMSEWDVTFLVQHGDPLPVSLSSIEAEEARIRDAAWRAAMGELEQQTKNVRESERECVIRSFRGQTVDSLRMALKRMPLSEFAKGYNEAIRYAIQTVKGIVP